MTTWQNSGKVTKTRINLEGSRPRGSLQNLTDWSRMRANDGAVDSAGRFWVEAFDDPNFKDPTDEGVLFRLDLDGKLHLMYSKVTIPNGISWNAKDDTMFFTDSPVQNVYAFDFDAASGNISNKRTFFHLDEEGVHPDGHAMDV